MLWQALSLYLLILLTAAACWPVWTRLCTGLPDRGAGSAIAGGIVCFLFTGTLLWRAQVLPPRTETLIQMVFLSGAAAWIFLRPSLPSTATRRRMLQSALQGWGVFLLLYGYWILIRSADPGVTRTEQPMDMMWIRSAMAAPSPPLTDAWFGGAPASYYADGHQFLAFIGRLAAHPPPVTVNTTQALLFALSGLLIFDCVRHLLRLTGCVCSAKSAGWGVLLVLFGSTLPGIAHALRTGNSPNWWWQASRVLRDGETELITEFPFFSFWLGDNHAHVIGIPVVLLSVLGSLQLCRTRRPDAGCWLLVGTAVVWSWRVNAWQTPAALALPLLALLSRVPFRKGFWHLPAMAGLLPPLLFLYPPRAPGPPLTLAFQVAEGHVVLNTLTVFGLLLPGLFFLPLRRQRLPVLWLLLCVAMLLVPEFVYLEDAFQTRMNTVFKVYYQVWVLLGILSAAGLARGFETFPRPGNVVLVALLVPGFFYAGRLSLEALQPRARSLDARTALSPEDVELLTVADRLIAYGDRIAEAPGISFQPDTSFLGTWTAGSTLIGWTGHQQQWRPGVSHPPVGDIYGARSREELFAVLDGLQVDWVLLGPHEQALGPLHSSWETWMDDWGTRAVNQPGRILWSKAHRPVRLPQ